MRQSLGNGSNVPPSSSYINQKFLEVLTDLNANTEKSKWKEVKERFNSDNELLILIETASELASLSNESTLFRKKDNANEFLIALWLGGVLKNAKRVSCTADVPKFTKLDQEDLKKITLLNRDVNSVKYIQKYLLESHGIILIHEKSFSGMKVDGAVTRLNDNPVIGMSLRFTRYDNYWFTLMHELSHIALHYESLNQVVIDDLDDNQEVSQIEVEANRYATNSLIPQRIFNKSDVLRNPNESNLFKLAAQAEIHPIVAAGLIRNHLKNYAVYARLVNSIDVRALIEE